MPSVENKVCLMYAQTHFERQSFIGLSQQRPRCLGYLGGNQWKRGLRWRHYQHGHSGKENAYRTLLAHGTAVGLSEGLMGNSEVGHLNIGAGRVVWQDIVRIDVSIKKKQFHKNDVILDSCKRAIEGDGRLHLLGLQLLDFIKKEEVGELATVVGRYYAMDRDKRWERVKIAIDGLVKGEGEDEKGPDGIVGVIKQNYEKDITDEFLKPIIVNGSDGRIKDDDTLFFFNYRSDRMREIVSVLGLPDKPMEVEVPNDINISTMSCYNAEFPFAVAFPPQVMSNVLAECISKEGLKQAHVAETEKYAHVTFFFNGGIEKQFENEGRHMIPSPKVATYDKEPKMSAHGVAEKVAELLKKSEHEFIMCNFVPPDMVCVF
ncbi:hypothetical protein APHAL10511_004243 [Amanita phalloides]|nr:hypothetical protein APHAL10511_004243 [Amanita phalloides]